MKHQAKRKSKPPVRHHKPVKPETALMKIPAPALRPWELNQTEITLIKTQVAPGATDLELQHLLVVARHHRLDPFRGQIWFVPRKDDKAPGGKRWISIVGINGLRHIAARDHKDFGALDEPEFGPMHDVKWKYYDNGGVIKAPEWARVKAWKKGFDHPIVATVYWEEIYPSIGASPMVRQMPRHMLGKCAEAHAIRRAWPATDGLYIREEIQGPPEFTKSGRAIIYGDDQPGTIEMPPLDDKAPHGHLPGSRQADIATAALAKVEEEDRKLRERQPFASGSPETNEPGPKPPAAQASPKARPAPPAARPAPPQTPPPRVKEDPKVAEVWPRGDKHSTEVQSDAPPATVSGNLLNVVAAMTQKKQPMLQVKIGSTWHPCFRNTLFKFLTAPSVQGHVIEATIDEKTHALTGLIRIGPQRFDKDGVTPVMTTDREPGTKSLFGN